MILRWLPRYRINLMGTRCPLGKADWCVIENEFGELQIAHVEKQRFNERLSSFLVGTDDQFDFEKDPVVPHIQSFVYRYIKFFYNPMEDMFKTNSNWFDARWLNVKISKMVYLILFRIKDKRYLVGTLLKLRISRYYSC